MTPALALFYGGMVRRKERSFHPDLSYIFHGLDRGPMGVWGYSLAFGDDIWCPWEVSITSA
jgi:ammonia channel protein AmtB